MTLNEAKTIDWTTLQSTGDWVKTLGALLDLAKEPASDEQRAIVARALDDFATNSSSETDFAIISKLDTTARSTARILRTQNIMASIEYLEASSGEYRSVLKELDAVNSALKKEARLLRAEKVLAAAASLTNTIASLKELSKNIVNKDEEKLRSAIENALQSSVTLRNLLEASD